MSLPVNPAESLYPAHLAAKDERHRPSGHAAPEGHRFDQASEETGFDAAAPVSVDAETGAAVADLHAIDVVPLSVAISHYREDA